MKHILLVDDNAENLDFLQTLLEGYGWEVDCANHGFDALERALKNPPSLVISDLLMPVMDGYTLLSRWKGESRLKLVPFIVCTATYRDRDDETLARKLGADAFVLKPLEPDNFVDLVRRLIGSASLAPGKEAVDPESTSSLKLYNETLVRKLEQKTLQLEAANRALQQNLLEGRETEKVLRAEGVRLRLLNQVNEAMRAGDGPEDFLPEVMRVVAQNLELSICAYARVDLERDLFEVHYEYASGISVLGSYRLSELSTNLRVDLLRGVPVVLQDVALSRFLNTPDGSQKDQALVCFSAVKKAELTGLLIAHEAFSRNWGLGDVRLLQEVIERCRETVEQRSAERMLRQNEALLRVAGQAARLGGWSIELPSGKLTWSDEVCAIHDLPAGQVPALDKSLDFYPPEYRSQINARVEACIFDGTPFDLDLQLITAAQRRIWVRAVGQAERNQAGEIICLRGAFQDISKARQADDDLRKLWWALEQSPLAVLLVGPQAVIEYANQRFEELSGYSIADALGKDVRVLLESGNHSAELNQRIWEAVLSGQPWQGEICKLRDNGEAYWEWAVISPVRDSTGHVCGAVTFKDDLTSRKRVETELRLSEAKLKEIFETMEDGYVESVWGGPNLVVNRSAVRLLGYQDETQLRAVSLWQHLFDPDECHRLQLTLLAQGYVSSERAQLRLRDGSVRDFELNLRLLGAKDQPPGRVPSTGGGLRARLVVFLFRDITVRLRAEDEARARQAAEEANRFKSEFLANMSHEIRTPMHGVLGLAHLALQTELTSRQRDYLTKIQGIGRALLRIVNDILDFSKIEAGKMELERIDFRLDDVLDGLVSTLGVKVGEKNLGLIITVDPTVPRMLRGDPTRLGQVLLNLASNAVKFTAKGDVTILVTLEASVVGVPLEGEGGGLIDTTRLRFQVKDTGAGMDEDLVQRLFTAFTQADSSTTRNFGGTGLGLNISRRLVHLMQGEIWVESQPGCGSTFTFTAVFGRVVGSTEEIVIPRIKGLAALVVDENASTRSMLVQSLGRLGVLATEQLTLEGSLQEIDQADPPYRLLFVDQNMSAPLTSLEFVRRVRQSPRPAIQAMPIVLIANHGDGGITERALRAGASSILFKPFTQSHLLDTVLVLIVDPDAAVAVETLQKKALKEVARDLRGARVLVVEDNQINQQIARELLEAVGIRVDVADNGEEAVEQILGSPSGSSCPWDVVLMDLQMPVLDGCAATLQIRADPRFGNLPILAMTAHVLAEERNRCHAVGMDDYISKPIDPDELFKTLSRWIAVEHSTDATFAGSSPFPEIAGVDVRGGLRRVAGNSRLYRGLLLDLAHQQEATSLELAAAWDASDFIQIRDLAHQLKGVLGNLGVSSLESRAAELESRARQSLVPVQLVTDFSRELQVLSGRILDALPGFAHHLDGQPEPVKIADAADVLGRFAEQLKQYDGAALESLPEVLRHLRGIASADQMERLESQVHGFEFEQALQELSWLELGPTQRKDRPMR